jgi:hypothetical protein
LSEAGTGSAQPALGQQEHSEGAESDEAPSPLIVIADRNPPAARALAAFLARHGCTVEIRALDRVGRDWQGAIPQLLVLFVQLETVEYDVALVGMMGRNAALNRVPVLLLAATAPAIQPVGVHVPLAAGPPPARPLGELLRLVLDLAPGERPTTPLVDSR